MFVRMASAVTTGTFITLGLFYVMQTLIQMQSGIIVEPRKRFNVPWIMHNVENPVVADQHRLPDKDFIEPPEPPRTRPPVEGVESISLPTAAVPTPRPGPGELLGALYVDGPLVSIVRVAPEYPPIMAARGIEGYVTVQFDITAQGTVANVVVVDSSHAGFERAAISAAQKFRYKAHVVDGVPIASYGVQNRFVFKLNE